MPLLVLTVIGDDRAGLVNALADVVSAHGGNWERAQMAELAGKFAGIVTVAVPEERAAELTAALRPLDGLLDVTVQTAPAPAEVDDEQVRFSLDLIGNDRPGIVQEITRVLADYDVSIDTFDSQTRDAPMAGGRLFEAHASLHAPAQTRLGPLTAELERLAGELMVDVVIVGP